jgi:cutinase
MSSSNWLLIETFGGRMEKEHMEKKQVHRMRVRNRPERRRGLLALAFAALVGIASSLIPVGSASALVADGTFAAGCRDFTIIGVRGTNEPNGYGQMTGQTVSTLLGKLGSSRAKAYAISYPATFLFPAYWDSEQAARVAILNQMTAASTNCAATRFILVGYSQGAHAVGDVVADRGRSAGSSIAAVGLMGDPMYNPSSNGANPIGGYNTPANGVLGKRSAWPSSLNGKIQNSCLRGDSVCDSTNPVPYLSALGIINGNDPHHAYAKTPSGRSTTPAQDLATFLNSKTASLACRYCASNPNNRPPSDAAGIGSTPIAPPPAPVSGSTGNVSNNAAVLASELMGYHAAGKFTEATITRGSIFSDEIARIANGTIGSYPQCNIDTRVLQTLVVTIRHFGSVQVTDLNRWCANDGANVCPGSQWHCAKPAVAIDFGRVGGAVVDGSNTKTYELLRFLNTVLPPNMHVGQRQARSASLPSIGLTNLNLEFNDSPNHLHIDFGSAGNGQLRVSGGEGTSTDVIRTGYVNAFNTAAGTLWTIDNNKAATSFPVGLAPGTSPAILGTGNGGYVVAFQAAGGALWTITNGKAATSFPVGMAPGTSPAILGTGNGGYVIAFHTAAGTLWTIDNNKAATSFPVGLAPGTSPAMLPR